MINYTSQSKISRVRSHETPNDLKGVLLKQEYNNPTSEIGNRHQQIHKLAKKKLGSKLFGGKKEKLVMVAKY